MTHAKDHPLGRVRGNLIDIDYRLKGIRETLKILRPDALEREEIETIKIVTKRILDTVEELENL